MHGAWGSSTSGNPDADVHPSVSASHACAEPRKLGVGRAHDTLDDRIRVLLPDFREQ